jgi:hypothetical protein
MASVGYATTAAPASASKPRRGLWLLAAGGALILVLLVLVMQRTLGSNGDATSSPSTLSISPAQVAAQPSASTPTRRLLRTGARGSDPFAHRVVGGGGAVLSASTPAGFHDPFAGRTIHGDSTSLSAATPRGSRDPFLAGGAPAPAAVVVPALPQLVIGTAGPHARRSTGFIVVLASIETAGGRGSAVGFARRVRARGMPQIGVLRSSTHHPLRAGYFVVYSGIYQNRGAVGTALGNAHALGYSTAYVREILQYTTGGG